jgi:radical SAM superfamily enzyme YgiQ (UPF0313 family)
VRLLLVSVNRERSPYPVFPIGLSFLAGPLAGAGHTLEVLDLCFAGEPEEELAHRLGTFCPDAVLLSIRNMDNVTWPGARSYLEGIRRAVAVCTAGAPVILGGSGYSLMPLELLAELGGDVGVVGEGEEVLIPLLAALEQGRSPEGLPGVVVKGGTRYVPSLPVARIGTPDRRLFSVARYHHEGGMANLQTKRGCPFGCIYCTYPLLEGTRMRLRPVADVVAEIHSLVDGYGVEYLYFVDDIFNYPPDYALELCRAIIAGGVEVKWSAFINPQFVTSELMTAMVAAGCDAVEYGSDSGSAAMLRSLGKSFTVEDIRSSSALCRAVGVDFAHYIIFGGPGETEETIDETFRLMDTVDPTAVIGMTGIRIFPGTALYHRAVEEGYLAPETSLLEPLFYIAPAIRETLRDLVTERALLRRTWVFPGLEINMSDSMLEALRSFPVRGPLWKLMKRLGRNRVNPLTAR